MSKSKHWTGERLETDVFSEASIEHLHRYAIAMDLVHNKKVLDIACGEGYGPALLAGNADQVTGVDISAPVINKAKEKYQHTNLRFVTGTAEHIPAGDKAFDVVVSFETLEHIAEHEKMMAEIKRVLQPGGLLVISTPDKKNYSDKTGYKNPFHVKELYREDFISLLQSYFKNVTLLRQQITLSSVIIPENANALEIYKGNYEKINPDTGENSLYNIALASDGILPLIKNSLFNGTSILEQAVLAREKLVTGSITYKLGNLILYPAKLVRKLFKK